MSATITWSWATEPSIVDGQERWIDNAVLTVDGTIIDNDGCDAVVDPEPYEAAEDRLLARHGLRRDDVRITTP